MALLRGVEIYLQPNERGDLSHGTSLGRQRAAQGRDGEADNLRRVVGVGIELVAAEGVTTASRGCGGGRLGGGGGGLAVAIGGGAGDSGGRQSSLRGSRSRLS